MYGIPVINMIPDTYYAFLVDEPVNLGYKLEQACP